MQGPLSSMMKAVVSGKYTYLAHLMCSSACFFLWMTPNQYKLRKLRPVRKQRQSSKDYSKGKVEAECPDDIKMEF